MSEEIQCGFGKFPANLAHERRCQRIATRKWGDHWFCDEHGARTPTQGEGAQQTEASSQRQQPEAITIPRQLFEDLTEAARLLKRAGWTAGPGGVDMERWKALEKTVAAAVKIRDAAPTQVSELKIAESGRLSERKKIADLLRFTGPMSENDVKQFVLFLDTGRMQNEKT